jgi:tetratricopeptide (TPR) repeat protein
MIQRTFKLTSIVCLFAKLTWAQASPIDQSPSLQGGADVPSTETPTESRLDSTENRARIEARDRFATGLKLYEEGEFSLALIEFERAYTLVPDHRVLYNIGQVNTQLGRYARAVRSLRQYLSEGAELVPQERQESVKNDLNMLAARTASLFVQTRINDAEVLLDNDVIATTPMVAPVLVDAGEHRLTVRKTGYLPQTKPLALAGRDEVSIEMTLEAEPKRFTTEKTVIVERRTSPQIKSTDQRSLYLLLGWSGVGLLSAGWATAGYVGYAANQDRNDLRKTLQSSNSELNRLETKTKNWYLASDIFGATSIIAAGSMLYYTLSGSTVRERKPSTKSGWFLNANPRQIVLTRSF